VNREHQLDWKYAGEARQLAARQPIKAKITDLGTNPRAAICHLANAQLAIRQTRGEGGRADTGS
jgi:hypothetical protein